MGRYVATTSADGETATAVLLVNLGTPEQPTAGAVRRYLAEFLSDPRVVEAPRPVWLLILYGVILTTRPQRSAAAYQKIWSAQGSPLLHVSQQLAGKLRAVLQQADRGTELLLGMRYGRPSIGQALETLRTRGLRRLLVLPLYPQYSAATTATTYDAVAAVLKRWRWVPELRIINNYHLHPDYLAALADSVREFWSHNPQPERLLLSFHGLPQDYVDAGDPYESQCRATANILAKTLSLTSDQWQLSFQSRLGPRAWLKPYTDDTLKKWCREGIKRVHVLCPGFAVDCLETLEEIALANKQIFLNAGGEEFHYIPALNDSAAHVRALENIAREHMRGW